MEAVLRERGPDIVLFILERTWRDAVVQAERHLVLFSTPERAVPEIVPALLRAAAVPPPAGGEAAAFGIAAHRRTLILRLAEGIGRAQERGLFQIGSAEQAAVTFVRIVEAAARRSMAARTVTELILRLARL